MLHHKHKGDKQNLIWKEFQLGFAVGKDACSEKGCKYCQGDTKSHIFLLLCLSAWQKYTKICAWHTNIQDLMIPPNHWCTLDVCVRVCVYVPWICATLSLTHCALYLLWQFLYIQSCIHNWTWIRNKEREVECGLCSQHLWLGSMYEQEHSPLYLVMCLSCPP